jgi:hypothetical protein
MNTIRLVPETKLADLNRLAQAQGGALRAINNRLLLVRVKQHADKAFAALDGGDCLAAIEHIRRASAETHSMEGSPCSA